MTTAGERILVTGLFVAGCLLFAHDFLVRTGALGFDVPSWRWALDFLSGEWGDSRRTGLPVLPNIAARIPLSLSVLALAAVQMAVLFGVAYLVRRASPGPARLDGFDAPDVCADLMRALPAFAAAFVVALVFAQWLGWFPGVVLFPPDDDPRAWLSAIALPSMTLALSTWGFLWDRSRNPVLAARAPEAALLRTVAVGLGGLLIVEVTFALPGIGYWFLFALRFNDQPVLVGVSLPLLALAAGIWCLLGGARTSAAQAAALGGMQPAWVERRILQLGWLPALWFLLLLTGATFGKALGLPGPDAIDVTRLHGGPEPGHWFGTDALGRDMLARMLAGVWPPIAMAGIALASTLLLGCLFVAIGRLSSRAGRLVAAGLSLLASLPVPLTAICGVCFAGSGMFGMLLALLMARLEAGWRLAEGMVASIGPASRDSHRAPLSRRLRSLGIRTARALVQCVTVAVVVDGTLGFLGLLPTVPFSWGDAIRSGREHLAYAPQMSLIPVAMVVATLWSCRRLATALSLLVALDQSAESGRKPKRRPESR